MAQSIKNNIDNTQIKYYLPTKQFKSRESLLIQLCKEDRNVKTVYNTVVIFCITFIVSNTLREYIYNNRTPEALNVLSHGFGKFHSATMIWVGNNLVTMSTYFFFITWAKSRQQVKTKKNFDSFWILVLIGYYILTLVIMTFIIFALDLPIGSATAVSVESVRFLMKTHSFVRENAPKALSEPKDLKIHLPKFSKFLYFLYAPTLIYRDEYPRSKTIRYGFIFSRLMEVFAAIVFIAYWFEYLVTPPFKEAGVTNASLPKLFLLIIQLSLPSYCILWLIFIFAVHSTQNAVGEALRFGDRQFYTDWWVATSIYDYYKKWNWITKDWMYTYVYKDLYQIIFPGNKTLATMLTYVLSAIVHEWLYTVAAGYFLPLQLITITLSGVFLRSSLNVSSNTAQILYSILYIFLTSTMVTMYFLEYFARQNITDDPSRLSILWKHNSIRW